MVWVIAAMVGIKVAWTFAVAPRRGAAAHLAPALLGLGSFAAAVGLAARER